MIVNELPKRKPNRLKNYDYSQNGAYFITVCIKTRVLGSKPSYKGCSRNNFNSTK